MKIDNRQQMLFIVAAIGLAVLLGDRMVVGPLIKSWKDRSARITDLQKSVTQGRAMLGRETAITGQWRNMRTNTLPNDVSVAEQQMLNAVNRWSQDSRVNLTTVSKQWKRSGDETAPYATLECRMDATGTLTAITRFLYAIEKDPMAVRVESMELSSHDKDGRQITLGLQVSGLVLSPVESSDDK